MGIKTHITILTYIKYIVNDIIRNISAIFGGILPFTPKGRSAYTATGGGKYSLPVENAEKILIRNYISYDSQGIAQITDYRLVEYLCGEGK